MGSTICFSSFKETTTTLFQNGLCRGACLFIPERNNYLMQGGGNESWWKHHFESPWVLSLISSVFIPTYVSGHMVQWSIISLTIKKGFTGYCISIKQEGFQ